MEKKVSQQYSAMAVVFCERRILATIENIYGREVLSLPKGHIETGETTVDAAIRECFEETNVTVAHSEVIGEVEPFVISFTTPDGLDVIKTITPIVFKQLSKGNPKPLEQRISVVQYMNIEEFVAKCSYDNVRAIVQSALELLNK